MSLKLKLLIDYYVGGLAHALLKLPTILLGMIMRRDHDLAHCSSVTVIKMLGGGSLVIAYPVLLALKQFGRVRRLRLVTSPAGRPFGEMLGVFDEIITLRDQSLATLALDSLGAIRRLFGCDAIIDLEIHSRLTTVFSLFTCARNRVGFYTGMSFWRRNLSSHLLFRNVSNGIYDSYDQLATLFGAAVPEFRTCSSTFRSHLALPASHQAASPMRLGIAPCCSGLSSERTLRAAEWVEVLARGVADGDIATPCQVHLFGAPSDREGLDELGRLLVGALPGLAIVNHAGEKLRDSVTLLDTLDRVYCIDSALLHFARLLGKPTVSFWGPTDPRVQLRPSAVALETTNYAKLSCSPCVHAVDRPPCRGNNLCMRLAANPRAREGRNPLWVIQ
jgi:ADP-heptose:LPS heptosyltransferase